MVKVLFRIKCIETKDDRFELDKIYNMYCKRHPYSKNAIVIFADKDVDLTSHSIGNRFLNDPVGAFNEWCDDCNWMDYKFEYIPYLKYGVELI